MKYFFLLLGLTLLCFSHQGRLDSFGGHKNKRSMGGYHYHTSKKGKSIDPFHSPIRIQILKYGAPHGWGQKFSSIERCESERKRLIRENAGTDYSYVCAIK